MEELRPAIVCATLIGSLALFITDLLRYEVVALVALVVLTVTGCLAPAEAFAGFGAPATVMIASMYVFAEAFTRWGIGQAIGQHLLLRGRQDEGWLALRICLVGGLLSTVLSNTAVTACLMPVVVSVSRESRVPASRLLMPLSYATLLAGMVTVLGTSTNVAINSVLEQNGVRPFELFEFAHVGSILLLIGCLYFFGPGRLLLPRSRVDESLSEHYQVPKFVTEVLVEPSSTLINRTVADLPLFEQYGISVLGIVRAEGEGTLLAPGPYNRIRREDTLILQGQPDAIVRLRSDLGLRERSSVVAGGTRLDSADVQLVEAVVPAESSLAGNTLAQTDFRARSGLNVLALNKQGDMRPVSIGHTPLAVGDTLLIQGHKRDIERAREGRELLLLGEIEMPRIGRGALVTILILAAVLLLSAFGLLSLSVAALSGAVALILTRCLKASEAIDSIDWSVILLIAGMLALGRAFEQHGLAEAVAQGITQLGSADASPRFMLALLVVGTMLLSQIIQNVSAGVIMTPIALSIAAQLAVSPRPFLLAVIVGASSAFMSPVGHQSNTMVVGPGNYKYGDFVRVGAPLTVLTVIAFTLVAPYLFPF